MYLDKPMVSGNPLLALCYISLMLALCYKAYDGEALLVSKGLFKTLSNIYVAFFENS